MLSYSGVVNRHRFDPDPTFLFYANPDPDPVRYPISNFTFVKKIRNLFTAVPFFFTKIFWTFALYVPYLIEMGTDPDPK
jgi:hypothetical protein